MSKQQELSGYHARVAGDIPWIFVVAHILTVAIAISVVVICLRSVPV